MANYIEKWLDSRFPDRPHPFRRQMTSTSERPTVKSGETLIYGFPDPFAAIHFPPVKDIPVRGNRRFWHVIENDNNETINSRHTGFHLTVERSGDRITATCREFIANREKPIIHQGTYRVDGGENGKPRQYFQTKVTGDSSIILRELVDAQRSVQALNRANTAIKGTGTSLEEYANSHTIG